MSRARLYLFLVIGFCGLLLFFGPQAFLRSATGIISYPALLGNLYVMEPVKRMMADKQEVKSLQKTIENLTLENKRLTKRLVQLEGSFAYIRGIKEVIKFNKRYEASGQIAHILARHMSDDEHYVILDVGKQDGVLEDMVVVSNNAIVGKVTEVEPWHCKVCLLTDSQCKIGAYCAKSRVKGIHEGSNEYSKTHLKYVDHLANIQEGDLILTSGEGTIFPEGFSLGSVIDIESDGLFKYVSIKPSCDVNDIEYCTVMIQS